MNRKYKLVGKRKVIPQAKGWPENSERKVYQLQALRDIPEHNVKKGDLGGLVSSRKILSHEGSCWIGQGSLAIGSIQIEEDAYVGGSSLLLCDFSSATLIIKGFAKVTENAKVLVGSEGSDAKHIISGNSHCYGNSTVLNSGEIKSNFKIFGEAKVSSPKEVSGDVEVYGNAVVKSGVSLTGTIRIFDNAEVHSDAVLSDCIVKGESQIGAGEKFHNRTFDNKAIFKNEKPVVAVIPEIIVNEEGTEKNSVSDGSLAQSAETKKEGVRSEDEKLLKRFEETKKEIAAYETDIVKIIKYPVMTDRTDTYTMEMIIASKNAQRLSSYPSDPEFKEAVLELEKKFLAAESNALKIASTALSDEDKKKTEKAKDLLAIAADEGSSENEKKVSFKQAFKQLEGVIVVPEVAVDTFRVKIGLKELEM